MMENQYHIFQTKVGLDEIARDGQWEIVKWIADRFPNLFSHTSMTYAAEYGNLDAVKYLHGCDNVQDKCIFAAMDGAAKYGHLETVKWLHEHREEGCSVDAMNLAAENGHLEVVKWLHENRSEGCKFRTMDGVAARGHLDVVTWLHVNRSEGCLTGAMDYAAGCGRLDVIKWLHANRSEGCSTWAMDGAAARGHLHILQWLQENRSKGCSPEVMRAAARNGHLGVLKWLHHHCKVRHTGDSGKFIAVEAARGGHIEMLRWLAATHNVPLSSNAMEAAARSGHLAAMIALRSLGCKCSIESFEIAFSDGKLEILRWLFRHYPGFVNSREISTGARVADGYVRKWLYESGHLFGSR